MDKYKKLSVAIITLFFAIILPIKAYANSSWVWLSETRPYDVLPYVIVITLIIEILAVCLIAKPESIARAILFILVANICSFLLPYIFIYTVPSLYTPEQTLNHTPFYNVGLFYLFLTLAVELPTVYFTLKDYCEKEKVLLWTIIGSNVLTTMITAVVERIFCRGIW